jgi:signal transduction histidine kinase
MCERALASTSSTVTPFESTDWCGAEELATLAHDLKNPLTGVGGYAQILRRRLAEEPSPPPWLDDGLAHIEADVARMATLIDELVAYVRTSSEHDVELNRQETDLVDVTRRVATELQHASERHDVCVEAAEPAVIGLWDQEGLWRILENLVVNGIKYSPDGGRVLLSVMREDTAEGQRAVLSVHDDGIGIPASEHSAIFAPFQRGSNAIGRIGGSGLGLASVREIVEQHGGTVAVDSLPDHGSTFTVRLPLA